MSMPAKGKHHHLSHHHQQQHHSHQQQSHHQQQQQQTHQQHQQHQQQQQQPQPQQQQQHVNVNQSGVANTPQAYNAVVANTPRYVSHAGSEFHVPGQNYVAQPGGHVGGGGGSVGVQGGRGPPSLGSIQSIGQTTAGINPGGPQSGQQQPPQSQTPGVQQQQSQGPAPTTTPPVHTPSPQEMGKQTHLQAQPPMQQVYMPNPPRPVSQGYFPPGPRPQPPRALGHRSGQGGGTQVVGMQGVGGGGGQATAMFAHQGIPVPQGATMFVQNQVSSIHPGSHQQAMYSHALMPLFPATQQRHQTHQGQPYYPGYGPHTIVTPPNMYSFAPGQGGSPYFYPPTNPINISRASANAVSGGAQHVGGPLAGAQGAGGVPQGTLQQPSQQPQPIPSMAIPLGQTEVYTGMNGGTMNANSSLMRPAQPLIRKNAILDIVNPETGDNVAEDIYGTAAATVSGTSSNRETPQPQNAELAADFAARVAKAASEVSEPGSPVPAAASQSAPTAAAPASTVAPPASSGAPEHSTSQSSSGQTVPSITSLKIQTSTGKDPQSQCNSGSTTPSQNSASLPSSVGPQQQQQQQPHQQPLPAQQASNASTPIVSAPQQVVQSSSLTKPESKSLQFVAPEFWPRGQSAEAKAAPLVAAPEEQSSPTVVPVSKDNTSQAQPEVVSAAAPVAPSIVQPVAERPEPKKVVQAVSTSTPSLPPSSAAPAATAVPSSTNVSNTPIYPSNTANQTAGSSASSAIAATAATAAIAARAPTAANAVTAVTAVTAATAASATNAANAAAPPPAGINVPSFPGPIPRGTRFPGHGYSGPSIDFPTLTSKGTSNSSPPRRKNNHPHQQSQTTSGGSNPVTELPPSGKEEKERKISDRSNTGTSRGTTPTPAHPQAEQHHQRSNGETANDKSDASSDVTVKLDHHQKFGDGKAMQKQKNKNKLKHKDLNRKGAEKEGTDMDAFVNPAAAAAAAAAAAVAAAAAAATAVSKPEGKMEQSQQENKPSSVPVQSPTMETKIAEPACPVRETAKSIKDRENDSKHDGGDIESSKIQKIKNLSYSDVSKDNAVVAAPPSAVDKAVVEQDVTATNQQNHKDSLAKESTPTIEESVKPIVGVCNIPAKTLPNDVVDHSTVVAKNEIDVEAIVAQKNEENSKVSALQAASNKNKSVETPVIEKHNENEAPSQTDTTTKALPPLKYTYSDNQWSPRNVTGKKEYDREFLMKLQDDPKSRIRPAHLPEMEVVLKECITNRNTSEVRPFRDTISGRHDSLLPVFAKSNFNSKLPPLTKKSYQGKSKSTKPNVIHVSLSLREDVKLRETENAWRPARLKPPTSAEEDRATEALYKKVRSVLNKLTPQKFDTLVSQVRALEIDTQEKLQGVINLVFEKAVDEPNFSVGYALMCKELGQIKVLADEKKPENDDENSKVQGPAPARTEVNFRKLIIERCQMQFSKQTDDVAARATKVKEIEESTDPEKKKELQANLEEHDRRVRVRSVGNIRFIGELFKKDMLSTKIMNFCISHLLSTPDEESLECLCKLLTTIGQVLDSRVNQKVPDGLGPCFVQLAELAGKKNQRKISSRIRFMIQDVIDLRANQWVPRRNESKPKTMEEIQKEAENERSDTQLNNTPMNTPRKDDRNNDRRRNRGGGSGMEEGGWSQPVGKTRQQPYSVETSKLSTKAPAPDEMRLGSRSSYTWGAQSATKPMLQANKYALLDSMPSDLDKRPPLQVSGSRSTGPRDYGRSDYKFPWENKGSRLSSHQMNSGSSGREALMEGGRSQSITMPPSSMKMKPQPTSAVFTGSSSSFSSSTSNKPQKTEAELIGIVKSIMDVAVCEPKTELFIDHAMEEITDYFDSSSYELFVRELINKVLERTAAVRHQISALFSHLINKNIFPLSLFQTEFKKLLKCADDLVLDIPKIWTYLAEILSNMIVTNTHPLAEIKTTASILKSLGTGGKLMGELLAKLVRDQGPTWVAEKWDQSGLQWSDIVDPEVVNVDDIIEEYKLEFLNGECKSSGITSSDSQLTNEQIHDHLVKLMRESNFDHICSWILANVGTRVTEPQFIRILMTAILDVTVEERHSVWKLNENAFKNHQTLIKRFIADADADLELQCLFAIQAYVHKLEHPHGLLFAILTSLHQNDILSDDAFLTWESHKGEFPGHAVAIKGLTSFFTGLREPDSDDA